MKYRIRTTLSLTTLGLAVILTGCERPPMEAEQTGYRGTGMQQVINPRMEAELLRINQPPDPLPAASPDGPRAGDIYQNVQVLGHLSVAEFTRQMNAITNWVSPEQGCAYCHEGGNFADDNVYTKVVARRMLQMTQHINDHWQDHVGDTGVTCYTCHRGNNVPEYIWFTDPMPQQAGGMAADRQGMNLAAASVGSSALPYDPFTELLGKENGNIRVLPPTALPYTDRQGASIRQTYDTYGLMMHFSNSLGVNCVFCHNSRNFHVWEESPPARTTAWYGIRMVRDANVNYIEPLTDVHPAQRLGPRGDIAKLNCSTCHQGVSKPLYGVSMLGDYPALAAPPPAANDQSAAEDTAVEDAAN